jgi:hypothetical protein
VTRSVPTPDGEEPSSMRPGPRLIAVVQKGREDVFRILAQELPAGDVEVIWDRRGGGSCEAPESGRPERRGAAPATWTTLGFLLTRRLPDRARPEPTSTARVLGAARELSASLEEAIDRMRHAVERGEREPPADRL